MYIYTSVCESRIKTAVQCRFLRNRRDVENSRNSRFVRETRIRRLIETRRVCRKKNNKPTAALLSKTGRSTRGIFPANFRPNSPSITRYESQFSKRVLFGTNRICEVFSAETNGWFFFPSKFRCGGFVVCARVSQYLLLLFLFFFFYSREFYRYFAKT